MAALQTLKVSSSEESAKIGRLWALARAINDKTMKEDTIKEAYRVLGLSPPNQTAISSTLAKLDNTFDNNPEAVFTGKVQLIKGASGPPNVSYDIRKIAQTARSEVLRDMYVQNFIAMASLARYQNNLSAALMAMPHAAQTAAAAKTVSDAIGKLTQMNARIFEMSSLQQQDTFAELYNSADVLKLQASMAGDTYESKMPGYVLSSKSQAAAFSASAENSRRILQEMLAAKEAMLRSQSISAADEGLLIVMDPVMSITPAPGSMSSMRTASTPVPRNTVDPRATPYPAFLAPLLPDARTAAIVNELKTTGEASAEMVQAAIGKKRAVEAPDSDGEPSKNTRIESAFSVVRAGSSLPTVTNAVLQAAAVQNKSATPIAAMSVVPAIRPPVPSMSNVPTERSALASKSSGSAALTTAITQSAVQAMAVQASRRNTETPMPALEAPSRNTMMLALAPTVSNATIPVAVDQRLVRSSASVDNIVARSIAATSVEDTAMAIAGTLKDCAVKGHSLHIEGKVDPITLLTAMDSAAIGQQRSGAGIELTIRSTAPPIVVNSVPDQKMQTNIVVQSENTETKVNQSEPRVVNTEDDTAMDDEREIDQIELELKVLAEQNPENQAVFQKALRDYKRISAELEEAANVVDNSVNGPNTSEEIVTWITRFIRQGTEFANSLQKVLAFDDDCLTDGSVSYNPDMPLKLLHIIQQRNLKLVAGDNGKVLVPFEAVANPVTVQDEEDIGMDPTEDAINYVTTIIPDDYNSVDPLGTYTFQDASTGNTNSISNATTTAAGGMFERTLADGKVQKYQLDGTFLNIYTVCAHSCDTMLVLGLKSLCAIAVYALPPSDANGPSAVSNSPIVLNDPVIIQVDDIAERWPLADGTRVNMSVDIDAVAAIPVRSEETAIFVRYGQFVKVIGFNRTGRCRVIQVEQPDVSSFTALHTVERKQPPGYARNRNVIVVDDTWQLNNNYISERTLGLEWRDDAKAYSKVEAVWITPHYYIPCSTGSTSLLVQFNMRLLYAGVYGKALPHSYFSWMSTLRRDAAESKLHPNVFQRSLSVLATKNAANVAARNNLLASHYFTAVYCLALSDVKDNNKGQLSDSDVIKHIHATISGATTIYAAEDAELILNKSYTQFTKLTKFYPWWTFTGVEPTIGFNLETLRIPFAGFNPVTIGNKPMMLAWKDDLLMLFSIVSTQHSVSDASSLKTNMRELVPFAIIPVIINVSNDDQVISKLSSAMMDFSWAMSSASKDVIKYDQQALEEMVLKLTTDQEYRDAVDAAKKDLLQELETGMAKYNGMVLHQKKVKQEIEAKLKELDESNFVIDTDNKEQLADACQRLHRITCRQTAILIESAASIVSRVYSKGKLHPKLARSAIDVIDSVTMSLPKNAKKERESLTERVQFGREKLRAFEVLYKRLQDAGDIEENIDESISYATYCVNRFLVVRGSMVFIYTLNPGTLTENVELQNRRAVNANGTQTGSVTMAAAETVQQALYNYGLVVVPVGDLTTTLKDITALPSIQALPSMNLSSSSSSVANPSLPTKMNINVYGPQGNYDALQLQKVVDFGRPITCVHAPNVLLSKSNPQTLIRFSFGPHTPDSANGNLYNENDRKSNGLTYGSVFNFEEFIRPDAADSNNLKVPDRRRFTVEVADVISTYIAKNGQLTAEEEKSVRYSWAAACTYNRMISTAEDTYKLPFTFYVEPCDRLYSYISSQNFEQIFRMIRDDVWRAAHEPNADVSDINPFRKPKNGNFVLTHLLSQKFGGKSIGEICAMGFRALMRWMVLDSHDLEPGYNGAVNRITTKEQLSDYLKEQDIIQKGDFGIAEDISNELHDRNLIMGKRYTYPVKKLPTDVIELVDSARATLEVMASQLSDNDKDQDGAVESRSRKNKAPRRANVVSEDTVMPAILNPRAIVISEDDVVAAIVPGSATSKTTSVSAVAAAQTSAMLPVNQEDQYEVDTEHSSVDSEDEVEIVEKFKRKLQQQRVSRTETDAPAMSMQQSSSLSRTAPSTVVKKEGGLGQVRVKTEPAVKSEQGLIKAKIEQPQLPVISTPQTLGTGVSVNASSVVAPSIAPRSNISSSAIPMIAPRSSVSSDMPIIANRASSNAQEEKKFQDSLQQAARKEWSKPAPPGKPRSVNEILLYESSLGKSYSADEIASKRALQAATIITYTNLGPRSEKKRKVAGIMLLFDTTEAEAKKYLPNYDKYATEIASVRDQKIEEYRNSVSEEQLAEAIKVLKAGPKKAPAGKVFATSRALAERREQERKARSAAAVEDSPMPSVKDAQFNSSVPFAVRRRRELEQDMKTKPLPAVDDTKIIRRFVTSTDTRGALLEGNKINPRPWISSYMQKDTLAFEPWVEYEDDGKTTFFPPELIEKFENNVATGRRCRSKGVGSDKFHQMIIHLIIHEAEKNTAFAVSEEFCTWTHVVLPRVAEQLVATAPFVLTVTYFDLVTNKTEYRGPDPYECNARPGDDYTNAFVIEVPLRPYKWDGNRWRRGELRNPMYGQALSLVEIAQRLNVDMGDTNHGVVILQGNNPNGTEMEEINAILGDIWLPFRNPRTTVLLKRQIELAFDAIYRKTLSIIAAIEFGLRYQNVPLNWANIPVLWYHRDKKGDTDNSLWYSYVIGGYANYELEILTYLYLNVVDKSAPGTYARVDPVSWIGAANQVKVEDVEMAATVPVPMEVIDLEQGE